nr:class I SAM-dependent methyltransferase [uncultured Pseudodesulfovibrio sp.]
MKNRIIDMPRLIPDLRTLWDGEHKIPWNDPAFSARILKEHLSQDHDLASRKQQTIEAQAEWIRSRYLADGPSSILDLGCGPGLYATLLAGDIHRYVGIDFSPASIDYACQTFGHAQREFRLGNVVDAPFGGPYDLVVMLYGELNVFSPKDCRLILSKAYEALAPGGCLLIERQVSAAVKAVGTAPDTQTQADSGGLFSDESYVCITHNHWLEDVAVSLQHFHVAHYDGRMKTYRSTTKAWTAGEMESMLGEVGFSSVASHDDWPVPDEWLTLMSACK